MTIFFKYVNLRRRKKFSDNIRALGSNQLLLLRDIMFAIEIGVEIPRPRNAGIYTRCRVINSQSSLLFISMQMSSPHFRPVSQRHFFLLVSVVVGFANDIPNANRRLIPLYPGRTTGLINIAVLLTSTPSGPDHRYY